MYLRFDDATTFDVNEALRAAPGLASNVATLKHVVEQGSYEAAEASVNLPDDAGLREEVERTVAKLVSPQLRYVFVVGIGGSNLGTKAIYDALFAAGAVQPPAEQPQLVFVDTTNAAYLHSYRHLLQSLADPAEFLLVSISKSGGTTETIANTEILLFAAREKWGQVDERVVVISDAESDFATAAAEHDLTHLTIPAQVGGRYSVLSAVGLFPLAAIGVDIAALHAGARDMRGFCLLPELAHNPAAQGAAVMAAQYRAGKTINDTFVFNSELESLGKWYRQLLGESIGKEHDIEGDQVFTGITPTVSVGSTDLHSVGQLYLGGPKDKLTTFLYSTTPVAELAVPDERLFPSVVEMIAGHSSTTIMSAILEGTKIAYNKNELPFFSAELAAINPYELGAFVQYKMIEMMYLGQLLHVNPFDQPNVESYKIATKDILEG